MPTHDTSAGEGVFLIAARLDSLSFVTEAVVCCDFVLHVGAVVEVIVSQKQYSAG